MQPFDYIIPKSASEASRLLAQGDGRTKPLLGGTDLLIRMRSGALRPERVVDLKGLPGMQVLRESSDGWLVIGAACTINQVADAPAVRQRYDLLAQACASVASYQLRNRATIGGNCCNASPAADSAPALYCLDAVVEIFGPDGTRRLPISEFFLGPGRNALQRGEFLSAIHLPPSPPGASGAFEKLGRTRLGDIATVSVAVSGWPTMGGIQWRIALGAVGPTPLRALQAEMALARDSSAEGRKRAADLAADTARPIDDIRASAAYRKAMVSVLTRRGTESVLERLQGRRGGPA